MDRLDLHARILRNLKIVHSNVGLAENLLTNYPAIFKDRVLEELEAATREAAIGSEELYKKVSNVHEKTAPDPWSDDKLYFGTKEEEPE